AASRFRLFKKDTIFWQYYRASLVDASVNCSSSTTGCHDSRKSSASCSRDIDPIFCLTIPGSTNSELDWNLRLALWSPTTLARLVMARMSRRLSCRVCQLPACRLMILSASDMSRRKGLNCRFSIELHVWISSSSSFLPDALVVLCAKSISAPLPSSCLQHSGPQPRGLGLHWAATIVQAL